MAGSADDGVSRAAAGPGTKRKATNAVPQSHLHVRIIGTSAALGCDPVDVLRRVLDVARLAVNAVLGIDLKPRRSTVILYEFINACRTVALFGARVDWQIDGGRYVGVLERQ